MSDYILELEEACKTLEKHCEAQEKCKDCIFYSSPVHCDLFGSPSLWEVDKIFNKEE